MGLVGPVPGGGVNSMKHLYLVGGPMGVGKTTVCRALQRRLDRCVFLDGDWCWDMRPFQVTAETKHMVMDNICYTLNNFLHCSAYDHVVFCWVLHQQVILNDLLSRLDTGDCAVHAISLACTEEALRTRLQGDIRAGKRTPDVLERSLDYLPLYDRLDTRKIDTTNLSSGEAAELLLEESQ